MRGILQVLAAWCLVRAWAEPRQGVMDGVYWCNTLCLCRAGTQVELRCFQWNQLYELMASAETRTGELKGDQWLLEGQAYWCNELCLCNINDDSESKCVQRTALVQLVSDQIGDWSLYEGEEETEEEERVLGERLLEGEEEREEAKYRKRSEKRRKRKNRKPKKNARVKDENSIPVVDGVSLTAQPKPTSDPALTPGPTISSLPYHFSPDQNEPVGEESPEPLLKQGAASASPTQTTTAHVPTSRQALPTTAASAYTTHESTEEEEEETHSTAARVTPVREVPLERKTVASEVSQDLDELGRAVMQIKSDVILNQRILLVTVAVAGTAMLGVLIMAVHECGSRRQALANKNTDVAKDDDHVTKVNLEEAW